MGITNSNQINNPLVHLIVEILLSSIILTIAIGNVSALVAVFMEPNLQTEGNCLVLSVGIADILVTCLVIRLVAIAEMWSH